MKIGVIGPRISCDTVKKNLLYIDSSLEVHCYPRERVNQCVEVMDQCISECDVILFTGCAIESYVADALEITKPHTSVEKSIISIAEAFMTMQKRNIELDAFSVDVVESQVIEDILDEFHIVARHVYSCPFCHGVEEQMYVDWHIRLQDEKKTNVALTAFAWVYETLKAQGYRALYLGPTRTMVRHALSRLKDEYALNQAEYSQIAVEILRITNYGHFERNYYNGMLKKTEVERQIIQYVRKIQGSLFPCGRAEYIVFANAGVLKNNLNCNYLLKLQQVIGESGIFLGIGIGMGITAFKAEMNARRALEYSLKQRKKKKYPEIYRIDEHNALEGPMGTESQLHYDLVSSDPKLQEAATKTGLSVNSLLKIIAISKAQKSPIFDAHGLAECLGVTDRSARRIMNKILDAGFGRVYTKETSLAGGRPKALIELFLDDLFS